MESAQISITKVHAVILELWGGDVKSPKTELRNVEWSLSEVISNCITCLVSV